MNSDAQLHIPNHINFACTGCGHCCFSWPVPLTEEDVRRIGGLAGSDSFRRLSSTDAKLSAYTHTLEKNAQGECQFLTREKRCRLHEQYGRDAKPAMCKLFPYTFTPTPSGVYASISFASTGALFNSGSPLSEQRSLLEEQWQLFQKLMPAEPANWHELQIVDGTPLAWRHYVEELEPRLLEIFDPRRTTGSDSFMRACQSASRFIIAQVPSGFDPERQLTEARPKIVDQILLAALLRFLYPGDIFSSLPDDMPAREIGTLLVMPPNKVALSYYGQEISLSALLDQRLNDSPALDELLKRYVYCRIFSKLYFGPGYNGLSLLAGLHHLLTAVAIARLIFKHQNCLKLSVSDQTTVAAELIRTLERRLTVARLSRQSAAMLEVLLTSPTRMERVLSMVA
jgi:Fe-S-cluster containining protein